MPRYGGRKLKSRCHIKTDNIRLFLDVVKNLAIYNMRTKPDMAVIFNAQPKGRYINVQDGFGENCQARINFPGSRCSN